MPNKVKLPKDSRLSKGVKRAGSTSHLDQDVNGSRPRSMRLSSRNRRVYDCSYENEDCMISKCKIKNNKKTKVSKKMRAGKAKGRLRKEVKEQIKKKNEREKSLKKTRNNERRKEKSRDAARSRRGKESEIFAELGDLLPLDSPTSANLDKASVIRVAIAYLRTRSLVAWGLNVASSGSSSCSDSSLPVLSPVEGQSGTPAEGILGALDGFLLVLTKEGDIVYTSDNISTFLGLQQIDVVGHSLLDYTHPCDHDEARRLTTLVSGCTGSVFLRFKCTLTPKGRNINLKSASYKVVQVTGQVLNAPQTFHMNTSNWEEGISSRGGASWVVVLGVPVPHPSNIEVPLDKQTFVSKHSLDMKFTYVDENIREFCGYRPEDLLGRSLYQVNHALDTQLIKEAYKTLRSKGQVETGRYRFLSRGGGYVWVVTQATLITGHRDNKPQYVVCLNYVISHIECSDVIFSDCQLEAVSVQKSLPSCDQSTPDLSAPPEVPLPVTISSAVITSASPSGVPRPLPPAATSYSQPSPVAATCTLLRNRTEDMNEGYLTFADNYSHVTVLKEEPDDLTHLAPSVGEDCVPLEVPVFYPGFDDLLEASPSDFELPKLAPSSTFDVKGNFDNPFERLLHETSLSPQSTKAQGRDTRLTPGKGLTPAVQLYPGREGHKHKNYQEFLHEDFRYSPDLNRSKFNRKVPEEGVTSPGSGSPGNRFDTPEPPLSPLLSQAASPQTLEKAPKISPQGPNSTPATSRLFTYLEEENSPDVAMDFLNSLDLKLEDDPELRAPYIPPIDEILVFDQDIFGLSTSSDNHENRADDGSYLGMKQKFGDSASTMSSPNLESYSQQHSFQQTKMGVGADTGGNFVDPNQVLPGQFYVKGEEKDTLQELRYLLEAPPPSPVKEPVNPPPPLKVAMSSHSYLFDKGPQKRGSSPAHPTPTKRLRTSICMAPTPAHSRREAVGERSWANGQTRDLPTPNAPLMQQLLNMENSSHSADSPLSPLHSFPLNKEGKVELTRQQLTALLDRAGVLRPSFRSAPPTPPEEVPSPSSFSPSTPSTPTFGEAIRGERSHHLPPQQPQQQSSFFVVDSIPTIFDLASFDCDEGSTPEADSAFLQESELLMAMEQTTQQ